jgi:2-C-methyl-D-erythritol 4-phosphate cytidylyltransferase
MSAAHRPAVPTRALVPGYVVPRLIKGGWQLAGGHGTVDRADAIADMILGESAEAATSKGRFVESAIDRARVVAVQTPQVFEISLLRRAYAQADLSGATDDAGLVERLGERVLVVDGEFRNLKITVPDDLAVMRAMLGMKAAEGRRTPASP